MSPKKQSVNTTSVTKKQSVAKIKSAVTKLWVKCAEAEERTKLLQSLLEAGIGTNDVEKFREDQAKKSFGVSKNNRNEELVTGEMRRKLADSMEWERTVRKQRGQLRSKLEDRMGNRSHAYKNFVKRVREKVASVREATREKKRGQDNPFEEGSRKEEGGGILTTAKPEKI